MVMSARREAAADARREERTSRDLGRREFLTSALGASALPQVLRAVPKAASELGKVKIRDIKTAQIQTRYANNLVKIETDSGLFGIGEALAFQGIVDHIAFFKKFMIGQDPLLVETHWSRLMEMAVGYGPYGSAAGAIAGIESALWDLAGKILNVPIYVLLGGKYRDRVMVYFDTSPPATADPAPWVDVAMRVKSLGYRSVKFDIDWENVSQVIQGTPFKYRRDGWNRTVSSEELRQWYRILEAIRKAIGDDMDLSVDCHWQYSTRDALRFAQMIEPLNLLFLEDPTPLGNPSAMAEIKAGTRTPICTGENLQTRDQFRPYLEARACDVVQPDTQKAGGLLETKRIGDLADLYYVPLCMHNYATPVGAIGSGHVAMATRSFLQLESDNIDIPWWSQVIEWDGPLYRDGYLTLPEGPGLGVRLNEDVCRAHLVPGTKFFE